MFKCSAVASRRHNKFTGHQSKSERQCRSAYSPVTWSTRIREVMIRPCWEKSCSSSFWVMVFGSPLTYRFASLMEAELGRANETCKIKKHNKKCDSCLILHMHLFISTKYMHKTNLKISSASTIVLRKKIKFNFHWSNKFYS